jgi:hypothetical protein
LPELSYKYSLGRYDPGGDTVALQVIERVHTAAEDAPELLLLEGLFLLESGIKFLVEGQLCRLIDRAYPETLGAVACFGLDEELDPAQVVIVLELGARVEPGQLLLEGAVREAGYFLHDVEFARGGLEQVPEGGEGGVFAGRVEAGQLGEGPVRRQLRLPHNDYNKAQNCQ